MENNNSIFSSKRVVIDAVYVEDNLLNGTNQLPAPPNIHEFSLTLPSKKAEKDFIFLISCFAAVGIGGIIGLIIVILSHAI